MPRQILRSSRFTLNRSISVISLQLLNTMVSPKEPSTDCQNPKIRKKAGASLLSGAQGEAASSGCKEGDGV